MITRQGDWLTAKVGDELVMMSVDQGAYLGLSPVGARVWELIETPRSLDEVCERLVREFDVAPEVCSAEVKAFVDDLVKHGAAAVAPSPSA